MRFFYCYFCLNDLFVGESGTLKSCTVIVQDFNCDFMSSSICFMKLGALTFIMYIFTIVKSSHCIVPLTQYEVTFLFLLTNFLLKSIFARYESSYFCLISGDRCLECLFPFFHFKPVFIFTSDVLFLQAKPSWVLFFNPI
jgi:hypothetical protein